MENKDLKIVLDLMENVNQLRQENYKLRQDLLTVWNSQKDMFETVNKLKAKVVELENKDDRKGF